jgi:UDP-2-acetamido-2-deoxy-ribo-hexuluronate aminotransferase
MEFRDLKKQYQVLKKDIDEAVGRVMTDCNFISGSQVKELEKELAEYVGVKHCISCANGTDAMELALMTWGVGEGDAVFVPAFTFMSTAEAAATLGAYPVFVDIDRDTFNMDAEKLEEAIVRVRNEGKYTPRVVIPVDLFGLCADYDKITPIARKYNLYILEDGAQGFGGSIRGKKACSFGDISITSFFPAKPLGCYGDGGAIFTDNDEWAEQLRSLTVHGKGKEKYDNIRLGRNSRLDTIQAAILSVKFKAFREYELTDINQWANEYTKRLKDTVKVPVVPDGYYSSWAQYTLLLSSEEQRNGLQSYLKEQGIPSMVYYPKPLHLQTAYKYCAVPEGSLPVSENASKCVLSIPLHPYMDCDIINKVSEEITKYIK